jgi:hypothetical protein
MNIPASTMQGIGAGMSAVGSGVSAISQYKRGQAEKAAYDYNADVVLQRMKEEEQISEEKFSALMGRQRADYAKAGVDITSGSPLLVLADTARKEALEQQRIAAGGRQQADVQRYYGRIAAYEGTTGAMSTFLTGLGRASTDLYKRYNPVTA